MKTTQKIKRVQLKVNHDDGSSFIGIVSAEPDYRLSLVLNKTLKISLKSYGSLIPAGSEGNNTSFSRFSDHTSPAGQVFDLVSNRQGKDYLLKKLKNIDYIFRIYDPENEIRAEDIASTLRSLDGITAIFSLDLASLNDKNLHLLTL